MHFLSLSVLAPLLGFTLAVLYASLKRLVPAWWARPIIRRVAIYAMLFPLACLALCALSYVVRLSELYAVFRALAWIVTLLLFPVALSLPIAALVRWALSKVVTRTTRKAPETNAPKVDRRQFFIEAAAATAPAIAAISGVRGLVAGQQDTALRRVTIAIPNLPDAFVGLTILHLSDLHLGMTKSVADLEGVLEKAELQAPDLVLVTGDVADSEHQLHGALALLENFHAKHGVYCSLGNHEYLNDIERQRPIFERSKIPLLVNRGIMQVRNGNRLYIAGIDDPVAFDRDVTADLASWVEHAAEAGKEADLRILLSHRPQALIHAANHGFHLVLSGHTHGGQIGAWGRSLFDWIFPNGLWWGSYSRKSQNGHVAQLYTTSGFGDWFPFRIGCPTEAPLITLVRA